jgi:glycerol kinase
MLPAVHPSSEVYGEVSALPGLNGISIAGIAGDQQAALFGQRCTGPGLTKNTYGTGCFMLQSTGNRAVASTHPLLTTVAWRIANDAVWKREHPQAAYYKKAKQDENLSPP